jgi:hypothetical protein
MFLFAFFESVGFRLLEKVEQNGIACRVFRLLEKDEQNGTKYVLFFDSTFFKSGFF